MVGFCGSSRYGVQRHTQIIHENMKHTIDTGFASPTRFGPFIDDSPLSKEFRGAKNGCFYIQYREPPNTNLELTISTRNMDNAPIGDLLFTKLKHPHSVNIGNVGIFEITTSPIYCLQETAIQILGNWHTGKDAGLRRGEIYDISIYEFVWSDFEEAVGLAVRNIMK